MSIVIRDGKGTEKTCRVTASNQLATFATMVPQYVATMVKSGVVFDVFSGIVALTTTGAFNGVLYLSNTGTVPVNVATVRHSSGAAASWQVYKNASAGTLISEASAATVVNRNLGSTKTLSASAYKAAGDGKTITDGTVIDADVVAAGASAHHEMYILPPAQTLAWACKPTAACDVAITLLVTNIDLATEIVGE